MGVNEMFNRRLIDRLTYETDRLTAENKKLKAELAEAKHDVEKARKALRDQNHADALVKALRNLNIIPEKKPEPLDPYRYNLFRP